MTNDSSLVEKIHSGSYWRVLMRPERSERRFASLAACRDKVQESRIALRGWDYPHIGEIVAGNGWIASGIEWENQIYEYWRLFESAQFVHHFTTVERFRELPWKPAPQKYILFDGIVYTSTEVFEYGKGLFGDLTPTESIYVEVTLNNVQGHTLTQWDLFRTNWFNSYVAIEDTLTYKASIEVGDLVTQTPDRARDCARALAERFGLLDISEAALAAPQQTLLERSFAR